MRIERWRPMSWLRDAMQDLPYATRTLRCNPSFALIAIVTLGLGIGANTAISGDWQIHSREAI